MFPIPVGKGANRAFIDTVDKFTEESLLQGEMKVTINNLANRLNLNLLRMDMTKIPADPTAKQDFLHNASTSQLDMSDNAIRNHVTVDQTLFYLLKRLVEEKKEKKVKEEKKKENTYVPDTTPFGEKKDSTIPINPEYHPKAVEAAWMAWWEKKGFFHPDIEKISQEENPKIFTMVIPPPNVTGALHLGHALMLAIEDAVTRWKRMQGYHALWLPGVDHAGIATQSVVEKQLWKENQQTRHDLGREEFVKKVWEWKEEYGGKINNQFRRVGISVDWERFVFTLDDTRSRAVKEAFVRMHEQGLVYRSNRLINWCCALNTTLSDLEVEHTDLSEP